MSGPYGTNEGDIWAGAAEELELQLDRVNLRLIHEIIEGEEKVFTTRDPNLIRRGEWGSSILGTLLCPRCERNRFTPYKSDADDAEKLSAITTVAAGYAPPALSRMDNVTYICSPCGQDEAMRQMGGEAPISPDEWPLVSQGQYGLGHRPK